MVPVFGQKIVSAALRQIVLSDLTAVAANFSCDLLRYFIYFVALWASLIQKPSNLATRGWRSALARSRLVVVDKLTQVDFLV